MPPPAAPNDSAVSTSPQTLSSFLEQLPQEASNVQTQSINAASTLRTAPIHTSEPQLSPVVGRR